MTKAKGKRQKAKAESGKPVGETPSSPDLPYECRTTMQPHRRSPRRSDVVVSDPRSLLPLPLRPSRRFAFLPFAFVICHLSFVIRHLLKLSLAFNFMTPTWRSAWRALAPTGALLVVSAVCAWPCLGSAA